MLFKKCFWMKFYDLMELKINIHLSDNEKWNWFHNKLHTTLFTDVSIIIRVIFYLPISLLTLANPSLSPSLFWCHISSVEYMNWYNNYIIHMQTLCTSLWYNYYLIKWYFIKIFIFMKTKINYIILIHLSHK